MIFRICLYLRKNTSRGIRASQGTFSSCFIFCFCKAYSKILVESITEKTASKTCLPIALWIFVPTHGRNRHIRGMIQNNVDFCYNFNTVQLTAIKIIWP